MTTRGPRLEFAVGAFLLLALGSLLVLALASTNNKFGFGGDTYPLKARFTNVGQLRPMAPVKLGGVVIGQVESVQLDPQRFDSIVTLSIDDAYRDLPLDTSAGILTDGLLGQSYVGLQPGGDMTSLQPGEEIAFTTPAVDLIQMVGKYMFSGGGASSAPASGDASASEPGPTPPGDADAASPDASTPPTEPTP